jgi:flavorubredoxin
MSDFPREIAPNIDWFGNCLPVAKGSESYHAHLGVFLLQGEDKTLLVDTGMPRFWPSMKVQLDAALRGRPLDYLFPTHPESPHAANTPNIHERYPNCRVVGDTRDYALYYPKHARRLDPRAIGDEIDLGGLHFTFIPAIFKDLPSSMWGYESTHQVMFVADGFAFLHSGSSVPEDDDPLHRPGECTLTSSELIAGLTTANGDFIVRASLYWSRFVEPAGIFEQLKALLKKYPTKIIAPAHGNVIVAVDKALPIVMQTHVDAFETTFNPKATFSAAGLGG